MKPGEPVPLQVAIVVSLSLFKIPGVEEDANTFAGKVDLHRLRYPVHTLFETRTPVCSLARHLPVSYLEQALLVGAGELRSVGSDRTAAASLSVTTDSNQSRYSVDKASARFSVSCATTNSSPPFQPRPLPSSSDLQPCRRQRHRHHHCSSIPTLLSFLPTCDHDNTCSVALSPATESRTGTTGATATTSNLPHEDKHRRQRKE